MAARALVPALALAMLRAWSCARVDAAATAPAPAREPTPAPAPASVALPITPASPDPPAMEIDWIPYGEERLRQMEQYSLRHYGEASHTLAPRAIVLHFTATRTYQAAREVCVHNHPHRGELPGVCAHYVIDKDGSIYALVPLEVRCRHAIGLNDSAVGIEMVQEEGGRGDAWGDAQILARPAQLDAALRLVRWLQARYSIADDRVMGHATANASGLFHDLEGWRNDHGDWGEAAVRQFRAMLAQRR